MPEDFAQYSLVQSKAKKVLEGIAGFITARKSEKQIAERCISLLADEGIHETWYYGAPALVLLGARSCLSISGREYEPSDEEVGSSNLVTIDLSPVIGEYWGDCARSFCVENGRVTTEPKSEEFRDGVAAQNSLHTFFFKLVKPDMVFEDVWSEVNNQIDKLGYRNLDFMGNVGHSIAKRREDRVYFEKGNSRCLGEVSFFTFEPHISTLSGKWGFKHENIYYFDSSGLSGIL